MRVVVLQHCTMKRIEGGRVLVHIEAERDNGERISEHMTVSKHVANSALMQILGAWWGEKLIESGGMGELLAHLLIESQRP